MIPSIIITSTLFLLGAGDVVTTDKCFSEETQLVHCHCEKSLTENNGYYPEAKLICNGIGAMKEATKLLNQPVGNLLFVELHIKSSSQQRLTHSTLKGLQSLKKLILTNNKLHTNDPLAFQDCQALEYLDLSQNKFVSIANDTFRPLFNLKHLLLANNEIESFGVEAFPFNSDLLYLDLSGNNLNQIDSMWFANLKKLQYLSLARNHLLSVKQNSFQNLQSLESLDLSGNKLTDLSHLVLFQLKNLRNISLAKNNLKTLNDNLFKGNKMLEKANLTGNPFSCDRHLIPWHDWLKTHEIDRAYCAEPLELSNTTLQIGLYILYLEVRLDESAICSSLKCNCSVSRDKQVVTVDCVGRGFTKLPETLPYMTRVVDLRSNYITSLATDYVNATQWADVTFLHLNNNLIDSLKGLEGNWLVRNLVALHLTNNQLNEIPIHILEQFRGGLLDELYLSGNPWNCDCNTVRFQTWLQDNYKTIKDFDDIRCSKDSGIYSDQPIFHLLKSQLCPQQDKLINYLDVLNGLMAVVIVLIIVKLSVDFWRQKRTGKLPQFFSLNI